MELPGPQGDTPLDSIFQFHVSHQEATQGFPPPITLSYVEALVLPQAMLISPREAHLGPDPQSQPEPLWPLALLSPHVHNRASGTDQHLRGRLSSPWSPYLLPGLP